MESQRIKSEPGAGRVTFSADARDFSQAAGGVPCQHACPARTNVPGYIRAVYDKRYGEAYEVNRAANILPGVLGRICSRPCEAACRHGEPENGESVAICHLKRACADLKSPSHRIMESFYAPSGKRVAVVGAGPAGLAAAHDLALLGHEVVVFEAMEKPGGMLMYGIPEFRLPRGELMAEISNLLRFGVTVKTGMALGRDFTLDSLRENHDAVVIATGCTRPQTLGVDKETLDRVYNGLDFMKRVNAGTPPFVGERVVVIGAGFTAVDCARSAVRLGAGKVSIHIRRTIEEMRIDASEKHEAGFEGIAINSLAVPSRILDRNGTVTGIEFLKTRLEPGEKEGSKRVVPIDGSEFTVACDTVIAAIGQVPDVRGVAENLFTGNEETGETAVDRVFAAGDFVTGSSDVISAIAGGRRCARSVDRVLTGTVRKQEVVRLEPARSTDRSRAWDFIPKVPMDTMALAPRIEDATGEVETGYTPDQAGEEARRCYLCNLKYEIDPLSCIYCFACIDVAPKECIKMVEAIPVTGNGGYGPMKEAFQWDRVFAIAIDNAACIRCGQCYDVCPMDCISITRIEQMEVDIEASGSCLEHQC